MDDGIKTYVDKKHETDPKTLDFMSLVFTYIRHLRDPYNTQNISIYVNLPQTIYVLVENELCVDVFVDMYRNMNEFAK